MASSNIIFTRPDGISDTKAFYSTDNFYATHNGYLFSKLGQIAGWDITPYQLNKGTTVGMNSINTPNATGSITISVPTSEDGKTKASQTKAFFANGDNFYVTHQGFLKSNAGRIGNWHISTSGLSNVDGSGNKLSLSPTNGIQLLNGADATKKFKVNANGYLESTSGKIGGWNISTNALSSGNITITAGGGISTSAWGIYNDGSVKFTKGTIGGITIQNDKIGDAGGSWYISKNSVYLPNLYVDSGAVTYNVSGGSGTGGISSSNGGVGIGNGGHDWVSPTGAYANSKGTETLATAIKKLVVQTLDLGSLNLYASLKVDNNGNVTKGDRVAYLGGNNVNFTQVPVAIKTLKVPYGGGGSYKEGVSGVLKFSNNATMTFAHGLLITDPYIPASVSGMNWK